MSEKSFTQFFTLVVIAMSSQFAADVYSPSIPAIADDLNTQIDNVQWTMSIYMFGTALMQFFYGSLSEGFGRKIPMIIGLLIMLIGSIICVVANNIDTLLVGRFIQGIGISACACLWRSVFRDLFSRDELAQYASYFTMIVVLVIPSAPLLGGFIQDYLGWRANFAIMFAYNIFALILLIFFMKETSTNYSVSNIKIKIIVSNYLILLKSPVFMGIIFSVFFTYGAFFSWFVIGPVILIDRVGISPSEFGMISCISGIITIGIGGIINGKLVKKYGTIYMLRCGWSIMTIGGIMLFLGYHIVGLELWTIIIPISILTFGTALIWPNTLATAFTPFGHIAGYAAALYGTVQVAGGAALSSIFAYLPDENQLIFSIIVLLSISIAWGIYELIVRPNLK